MKNCPICYQEAKAAELEQFGDIPVTHFVCQSCGHRFMVQGDHMTD